MITLLIRAVILFFALTLALIAVFSFVGASSETEILLINVLHPEGDIYLVDAGRGFTAALTRGGGFDGAGVWSADGQQIVFASNRTGRMGSYLISAFGGTVSAVSNDVRLAAQPAAPDPPSIYTDSDIDTLVWSPDGTRIAALKYPTATLDPHLILIDGATGRLSPMISRGFSVTSAPAWSADGLRIAIGGVGQTFNLSLMILTIDEGTSRAIPAPGEVTGVAWRPKGQ